jgi:elongation factor G
MMEPSRTSSAVLSLALQPKTFADQEKLGRGLNVLIAEDPLLLVKTDPASGEVWIGGVHEQHLEIVIDRLMREFGVEAIVGRPTVAFKETVTQSADGEMKYLRQTPAGGEYGHVKIHLHPGARDSGFVFVSMADSAIPDRFVGAVEDGIRSALAHGVLAGHPVDDVRVELYDGSYHEVQSSAGAFRAAASMAFQDAARKASPVVLEPIMRVQVVALREHQEEVHGSLTGRRGQVVSHENRGGALVITAYVPLSELFGYATDLRSRTRGRATHTIQFAWYQTRPGGIDTADGDPTSAVTAPRRPPLKGKDSGIALPEPDDG